MVEQDPDFQRLVAILRRSKRVLVLTGAGCSAASGIPVYRDLDGRWSHRQPMTVQRFLRSEDGRRRYWAGSFVGWPQMAAARPSAAHETLAALERRGLVGHLVTQNVDGLHRAAGHRSVTALHGRLDRVVCLSCAQRFRRSAVQRELERLNPKRGSGGDPIRPDGDVDVTRERSAAFRHPDCPSCGGWLKPDVVFFGENVPRARVERAYRELDTSDLLWVVGSSLMIWSGYRFVRRAAEQGLAVVAVNLGKTRADDLFEAKLQAPCEIALPRLFRALEAGGGDGAEPGSRSARKY